MSVKCLETFSKQTWPTCQTSALLISTTPHVFLRKGFLKHIHNETSQKLNHEDSLHCCLFVYSFSLSLFLSPFPTHSSDWGCLLLILNRFCHGLSDLNIKLLPNLKTSFLCCRQLSFQCQFDATLLHSIHQGWLQPFWCPIEEVRIDHSAIVLLQSDPA